MPSGTSSSCAISLSRRRSSALGDLAADAAAARGVRHQHRIAAGERQIGGQRRALGAALLLDHLHQHHLPALDDLLDLVLPARARHALGHFLHGVGAADRFDDLFLAAAPLPLTSVMLPAPSAGRLRRRHGRRLVLGVLDGVAWFLQARRAARRLRAGALRGSRSVAAREVRSAAHRPVRAGPRRGPAARAIDRVGESPRSHARAWRRHAARSHARHLVGGARRVAARSRADPRRCLRPAPSSRRPPPSRSPSSWIRRSRQRLASDHSRGRADLALALRAAAGAVVGLGVGGALRRAPPRRSAPAGRRPGSDNSRDGFR